MSDNTTQDQPMPNDEQQGENLNPAEPRKTPRELVKEQQAMQQKNRQVADQRVENDAELPGHGVPSDRRKHPQRKLG